MGKTTKKGKKPKGTSSEAKVESKSAALAIMQAEVAAAEGANGGAVMPKKGKKKSKSMKAENRNRAPANVESTEDVENGEKRKKRTRKSMKTTGEH